MAREVGIPASCKAVAHYRLGDCAKSVDVHVHYRHRVEVLYGEPRVRYWPLLTNHWR